MRVDLIERGLGYAGLDRCRSGQKKRDAYSSSRRTIGRIIATVVSRVERDELSGELQKSVAPIFSSPATTTNTKKRPRKLMRGLSLRQAEGTGIYSGPFHKSRRVSRLRHKSRIGHKFQSFGCMSLFGDVWGYLASVSAQFQHSPMPGKTIWPHCCLPFPRQAACGAGSNLIPIMVQVAHRIQSRDVESIRQPKEALKRFLRLVPPVRKSALWRKRDGSRLLPRPVSTLTALIRRQVSRNGPPGLGAKGLRSARSWPASLQSCSTALKRRSKTK